MRQLSFPLFLLLLACAAPFEVEPRGYNADSEPNDCSDGICELLATDCAAWWQVKTEACAALVEVCHESRCKACALASEMTEAGAAWCEAALCVPDQGVCNEVE